MIARLAGTLLPLITWGLLTSGAVVLWGVAVGSLVLGGLLWVDLYLGDRLRGDA